MKKRRQQYSELWQKRAKKLQINIEAAISMTGDQAWLYRTLHWVREIADGHAPQWWSDQDCEAVLPREEKRVHLFIESQMLRGRSHKPSN